MYFKTKSYSVVLLNKHRKHYLSLPLNIKNYPQVWSEQTSKLTPKK